MASAADRLIRLLQESEPVAERLTILLDGFGHAERVEAIRALGGAKRQRRLWGAVADGPRVEVDDLVPPDAPALREFVYEGKNSLPAFTHFQKRFCRPSRPSDRPVLWGYNHTPIAPVIGPGYFVCHRVDDRGAAIDYREVPPEHPPTWPPVRSNARGLSWFVYRGMVDYLRRVSTHVFIGSAHRQGTELGNYFVLCRVP